MLDQMISNIKWYILCFCLNSYLTLNDMLNGSRHLTLPSFLQVQITFSVGYKNGQHYMLAYVFFKSYLKFNVSQITSGFQCQLLYPFLNSQLIFNVSFVAPFSQFYLYEINYIFPTTMLTFKENFIVLQLSFIKNKYVGIIGILKQFIQWSIQ